jgi:hypothetical protein
MCLYLSGRDNNERRRSRSPRRNEERPESTRRAEDDHRRNKEREDRNKKDERVNFASNTKDEKSLQKEEEIQLDEGDADALMMAMMGDDDEEAKEEERRRKRREKLLAASAPIPPKPVESLQQVIPVANIVPQPVEKPLPVNPDVAPDSAAPASPITASSSAPNAQAAAEEPPQKRDRSSSIGGAFDIFSSSPAQAIKPKAAAKQGGAEALQMMGDEAHLEDNWQDGEVSTTQKHT